VAAWPMEARAQQPRVSVVGLLGRGAPDPVGAAAIRRGLNETGFTEGRNLIIEERWGHNVDSKLPELVADLLRQRVVIIMTMGGTRPALAAKAAISTTPIVFETGSDPVRQGLVASMNRPGGNLTGISILSPELGGKRFSLLHDLLPSATRFAVLVNENNNT